MIGIDLFAGAGGMTIGAKQAGIQVQHAVESDQAACLTYSYNNPTVKLFNGDIQLIKKISVRRKKGQPVIVFGGPPCQGFSTSNRRNRNASNNNNWLFEEFVRFVKLIKPLPEWVLFENVRGFSETESGFFLVQVLIAFEHLGYTVNVCTLNAADYGVPQRRRRFFAIASLDGCKVNFPTPIKAEPPTVQSALSDLPELQAGSSMNWLPYATEAQSIYAKSLRGSLEASPNHQVTRNSALVLERYRHIPQGGNWQDIPVELTTNYQDITRCHTGIYHRLRLDEPSIVIGNFRKNMLIHPTQHRGLSVREAARLQSFPDWFEFKGSIGFQQQQVGNAVPPLLANAVFKTIIDSHK